MKPIGGHLAAAAVGTLKELDELFQKAKTIIGEKNAKTGEKAVLLTFEGPVETMPRIDLLVGWSGNRAQYYLDGEGEEAVAAQIQEDPAPLKRIPPPERRQEPRPATEQPGVQGAEGYIELG